MSDPDPQAAEWDSDEGARRARRRLLKLALYTPPAIVATMGLSQQAFGATAPSCGPATCGPAADPCAPNSQCNPPPAPPGQTMMM